MKFSLVTVIIFISCEFFRYSESTDGYYDAEIERVVVDTIRNEQNVAAQNQTDSVRKSRRRKGKEIMGSSSNADDEGNGKSFVPFHLIHETVYEVLYRLSYTSEIQKKKFKKTIPCVHSATMDFIKGVNTILEVEIGSYEKKSFNAVKKNYSDGTQNFLEKTFAENHVNHPIFDEYFKFFYTTVITIIRLIISFWKEDLLMKLDVQKLAVNMGKLTNQLAMDVILYCEVPVSKFLTYSSGDYQFHEEITYLLQLITYPNLLPLNAWVVAESITPRKEEIPADEDEISVDEDEISVDEDEISVDENEMPWDINKPGSMSCYVHRLLLLLAFMNYESPNVLNTTDDIQYQLEQIRRTSLILNQKTRKQLMSTDDEYFEKWQQVNKRAVNIFKFMLSKTEPNFYGDVIHFKRYFIVIANFMEFVELSLLQCKVPLHYIIGESNFQSVHYYLQTVFQWMFNIATERYSFDSSFRSIFYKVVTDYNFFKSYHPYTVPCFAMSIFNMFNDLRTLYDAVCDQEFNEFRAFIEDHNLAISQIYPHDARFGKFVLYLDQIGAKVLNKFNHCIQENASQTENDETRVDYANILSKFWNFYEACGAPPLMMDVHWDKMNLPPSRS